nr:rhodanese-like domain-containing protein [uncultured Desulfobulbus sp.]
MKEAYQDISVDRLREYMSRRQENDYVLVDVRQPDEYAQGHIPGSVLIPLSEVPERLGELPVDKDLVVYCRSGHRSKAAALFIGSRPYVAGAVFNMVGGVLAWNGHLLPATPNLKVYDLEGTDQDVLYRAMDLEKGADRFYTALRQRYQEVDWAESLSALAGAEEAHARLIHAQWAAGENDPRSFEEVYAQLPGDIVEGGYTCAALLASLEEQPLEPCRSTLEMALTVEYSAYDLSRNIAHRFQGTPLEAMFNSIAEAEKEHMHLAAQALALCPGIQPA